MYPQVATAAINNLTHTRSFIVYWGSTEYLYCRYFNYAGCFQEAGTTCIFEEHDPQVLNYPELFPIKVKLTQQSFRLARPYPWFIAHPWCRRQPQSGSSSLSISRGHQQQLQEYYSMENSMALRDQGIPRTQIQNRQRSSCDIPISDLFISTRREES